jgi:16S rRNA A1518/A1519 N6-dimethyltransferase RsmA/KsgA/DIM1 with predicted DNA glycosylase/AP lyase activity
VFFFEFIYIFLLRYRGNEFNIINDKNFTDNIPTPYLFLFRIDKFFKNKKINKIVDIGCGSGRVIYFLSKRNPKIFIDGYELNKRIFSKVYYNFYKKKKIKIYNKNVLKDSFKKNYDLYFLADPFKKAYFYNEFFKKILKRKNKFYIVIVNNNKFIKSIKNLNLLDYYNINKSGYKIYSN